MYKHMTARYTSSCLAGRECVTGGKVYPGQQMVFLGHGLSVHDGACEDIYWGNENGRREAEQERKAFMSDPDMAMGAAIADHVRSTRDLFGEQAAAAEELAWEMKLGDW